MNTGDTDNPDRSNKNEMCFRSPSTVATVSREHQKPANNLTFNVVLIACNLFIFLNQSILSRPTYVSVACRQFVNLFSTFSVRTNKRKLFAMCVLCAVCVSKMKLFVYSILVIFIVRTLFARMPDTFVPSHSRSKLMFEASNLKTFTIHRQLNLQYD